MPNDTVSDSELMRIEVYYPNKNFLFFPLLLADRMRLLPQGTKLVLVESDEVAVTRLKTAQTTDYDLQVAICDPVAGDIGQRLANKERICVAGTMITGIPLWVCNTTNSISPVDKEDDLATDWGTLPHIIAYTAGTTSSVFAERLQNLFKKGKPLITHCDYSSEWERLSSLSNGSHPNIHESNILVLSADVLYIAAAEANGKEVVKYDYNFHRTSLGLEPYLFTGVLCLNRTLRQHLVAILSLINSLSIVVRLARHTLADPRGSLSSDTFLRHLSEQFPIPAVSAQSGSKPADEYEASSIYRRALRKLLGDSPTSQNNIFRWLEASPNEKQLWEAWTNAEYIWKRFPPSGKQLAPVDVQTQTNPIPSLLLRPEWQELLQDLYRRRARLKPSLLVLHIRRKLLLVPHSLTFHIVPGPVFLSLALSVEYMWENSPIDLNLSWVPLAKLCTAIVSWVGMILWVQHELKGVKERRPISIFHPTSPLFRWMACLSACSLALAAFYWRIGSRI